MNFIYTSCRSKILRSYTSTIRLSFFSTTSSINSGHSKWASIKHDKARNDAFKSRQRTSLTNDITKAIELFGPDQTTNPRLALAIAKAKRASCPKDAIDSAIARGQGLSPTGAKLEAYTEVAMIPAQSLALLVECNTDNKNRTRQEVRTLLKEGSANIATADYLFSKKGHLKILSQESLAEDTMLDYALDAGAEDVYTGEDGSFEILTEVGDINKVCSRLKETLNVEVEEISVIWMSSSHAELPLEDLETKQPQPVQDLLVKLRALSSVRDVYLTALE